MLSSFDDFFVLLSSFDDFFVLSSFDDFFVFLSSFDDFFVLQILNDHTGTNWWHPHKHGSTALQVLTLSGLVACSLHESRQHFPFARLLICRDSLE